MKDETKLNILMAFLIVLGILVLGIMAIQFEKSWNSKIYAFEDGEYYCNDYNMSYEVYFNGERYCDDGYNLYPIKISNGEFKFVKFAKGRVSE